MKNLERTETELCRLAYKYGSDKCRRIKHFYTEYYYELFKDKRESIKKVLEIGVGYPEDMKHCPDYTTGASLYMWRDFFPNAQIYGADIVEECIFEVDRIKTFVCNQNHDRDLLRLLKYTKTDIDFLVDDGSHITSDQVFTALTLLPYLQSSVIYCIEDLRESRSVKKVIERTHPNYKIEIIQLERYNRRLADDKILVIRKR